MKLRRFIFLVVLLLSTLRTFAQGTLEFDQQSTTGAVFEGGYLIQSSQPIGQSFTPSLNSVGFIQLFLEEQVANPDPNAVVAVNLLQNSITGPVVAQTASVTLGTGFEGSVNLFFLTPIAVSPGTTYYFQPVVASGGAFVNVSTFYTYAGGTSFINGVADPSQNFYFREGIVVAPEPSTWVLLLLGGSLLFRRLRR
jgi:hypothetical protein